jgi:hypothetical protein
LRKYGINSAHAVMRLLTMANIVTKEITQNQMRLLNDIALAQNLSQDDILRVVAEYEIDVSQAKDETQFFDGNPSLPQSVMRSALDEIEGSEMQLQVSQVMHGLLSVGGNTQKEEVFFVEHAVGYWGIGEAWRSWLSNQPTAES